MVMLQEGLNRVRDLISTDMTLGTLGASGTAAALTDTNLLLPLSATQQSITKTSTDRQVQIDYSLASTSGTSRTFKEFKTHNASYDFDRMVFTGIDFTVNGSDEVSITKKYFIRGT